MKSARHSPEQLVCMLRMWTAGQLLNQGFLKKPQASLLDLGH
jgi:hypothetical protein